MTRDGVFSIRSLCKILQLRSTCGHLVWRTCGLPKVYFFTWEAVWGKILALDQLKTRGVALANHCYLCHEHEEIVDHLLFHCEKTRLLRKLLFSLFGISWVIRGTVWDALKSWVGS